MESARDSTPDSPARRLEVRHNGEHTITNSRHTYNIRPPARLEPLRSIPNLPASPLVLGRQPTHNMNRQISTAPLVDDKDPNGLSASYTSVDMTAEISRQKLVGKTSQVHPTEEPKQEHISPCTTPDKDTDSHSGKYSCTVIAAKIITALIAGIYFGWFLQKSTVYKPESIRNQFLFREFIMLKAFLGALLTSQFVLLILSYIPQTKSYVEAAREAYTATLCYRGIISTVVGAFLLGAGMAVGGACPGMVLAQVGSLVPNSAYTILGGLLGCIVYGFLHKYLIKITTPSEPYKTYYIYEKIKLPFVALAVPCMALLIGLLTLMELLKPETQRWLDMKEHDQQMMNTTKSPNEPKLAISTCQDNTNWFTQELWSPSASGVMLGLVQIPIIMVLADTMGSSSGYMALTSQWVATDRLKAMFPYFAKARSGIDNYWMVIYITGAALGAALAAISSCTLFKAPGPIWWQGLVGGFLMLFGSRLASGCTSGHGISGTALFVALSWIAVPVMFAGGICTVFAMEYSGTNTYADTW